MLKRDVLKVIGKDKWYVFEKWMTGQTVGFVQVTKTIQGKKVYSHEVDYYPWDVEVFCGIHKIPFWQAGISRK
jgi:hypothetical protein